jgi:AraC-like DNA-binding protein
MSLYGLLHYYILLSQSIIGIAVMYGHFMPVFYLMGPLLLFYTKSTLNDEKYQLKKIDYFHFLPFAIGLISILPYYFEPFHIKTELAEKIVNRIIIHKQIEISWLYPHFFNTFFRPFLLLIYCIATLFIIVKQRENKSNQQIPEKQKRFVFTWLISITIITLIIAICYSGATYYFFNLPEFTNKDVNDSAYLIISAICYCLIPISLLTFPEILYGLPRSKNILINKDAFQANEINNKLKDSKMVSVDDIDPLKPIADRITLFINTEKPYLSEDFNIDDIADKLDIPKHHVYYCFSNFFDKKFTKLRTELRVQHAKELLLTDEINISSLEGIWTKSGFSSKTSFFTSFKEETGLTPKEYLHQKRFS